MISSNEREARQRLKDDLAFYSRNCLHIRPKDGPPHRLVLNASQSFLHGKLEAQLERTGRVRALVLKGRQMGISTYIGARFYHRTTHKRGCRTFILTHLDDATDNLFGMVKRFHDGCPAELRPETGSASAKELSFPRLDSGYKVGTAGNKAIGRSDTIQQFHGSEFGFWPNAEEHSRGIGQAIAEADGTEDIRESTANGIGNEFHKAWKKAEAGDSSYEPIFLPWFMHTEYATKAPQEWASPPAFEEYRAAYNLSREQIYWAWRKNREQSDDPDTFDWKFRVEYPANADEAFRTSGENHFIKPETVLRARKRSVAGFGPLVLGVDPARGGNDSMAIIDKQNRRAGGHVYERFKASRDPFANAGRVVQIVKQLKAQGAPLKRIAVDCSDGGAVYDILKAQLGSELVTGVMFGERAYQPEHYANRRAEMWDAMRQWLDDPVGVQIPDKDDLQGDLCCTSWGAGLTHQRPNGQLVLEEKAKIKDRLKFSPDMGDALALCFSVDYSELNEPVDAMSGGRNLGADAWLG